MLATADAWTARGRRDAAILLLLARLGLRASEIVFLELDDIRWRAGEIWYSTAKERSGIMCRCWPTWATRSHDISSTVVAAVARAACFFA